MLDSKKPTHEVIHPKLNMRVNRKLQRIAVGTELVLTDAQAKSLGNKVRSLKEKEKIDLTPDKEKEKIDLTPDPDKGKAKK